MSLNVSGLSFYPNYYVVPRVNGMAQTPYAAQMPQGMQELRQVQACQGPMCVPMYQFASNFFITPAQRAENTVGVAKKFANEAKAFGNLFKEYADVTHKKADVIQEEVTILFNENIGKNGKNAEGVNISENMDGSYTMMEYSKEGTPTRVSNFDTSSGAPKLKQIIECGSEEVVNTYDFVSDEKGASVSLYKYREGVRKGPFGNDLNFEKEITWLPDSGKPNSFGTYGRTIKFDTKNAQGKQLKEATTYGQFADFWAQDDALSLIGYSTDKEFLEFSEGTISSKIKRRVSFELESEKISDYSEGYESEFNDQKSLSKTQRDLIFLNDAPWLYLEGIQQIDSKEKTGECSYNSSSFKHEDLSMYFDDGKWTKGKC